eukprot:TRINITY_DN5513_c0_g1_i10.p1 TRINITY_DN5513_c0_g1~~TRINITY_DN5513_c0_g1_i10.p1  ORF type:complete len:298 (+),score=34.00 TRINITY_DN5513_c0_g1_i10:113-1006(+)
MRLMERFWNLLSGGGIKKKDKPTSSEKEKPMLNKSGGESRPDANISYGYSLLKGKRMNMEDCHFSKFYTDPRTGGLIGAFGIFDGHGGVSAANFVKEHIFDNIIQNKNFHQDPKSAIIEAYNLTDHQYLQQNQVEGREDGCTAVTVVVVQNVMYVANVGDSKCVLCRNGEGVILTVDHKPNLHDERERIENAGGVVIWAGTWRVGGVLAVSRAFGDKPLKKFVVAEPHIRTETLGSKDEFLILASDGVWDVLAPSSAIQLIRHIKDPEQASKRLSEEAINRGSNDNISCVVVRLSFK